MKVLFITKHTVAAGGVAVVLESLGGAMRDMGVEVTIYGNDPSTRCGRLPNGVPCVHGPLPKFGLLGRYRAKAIADLCSREKFDLIHAHSVYRAGQAARLVKRRIALPYVVTSHGDIMGDASDRMNRPKVRRRCRANLAAADAVTHLTPAMAAEAQSLCDVAAKSTIIPNGIHLDLWQQGRNPVAGTYIFTIGRHEPEKGFHVLIDAYRILAEKHFVPALVIAGVGPSTRQLHAQVRRAGLRPSSRLEDVANPQPGTVCFPGRVSEQTKRDLFAGCRFVVFPSQRRTPESFGIVQIEAFAAGKAIISGDIPASMHLVSDGINGLIVPAGDANAWADAIERLWCDEPLRRRIEQANALEAQKYDWADIAEQYVAVYRRVLGGAGNQPVKRRGF